MLLNEDGYAFELVTDESGRQWLKPTVTVSYSGPEVSSGRDPLVTAEQIAADLKRTLKGVA